MSSMIQGFLGTCHVLRIKCCLATLLWSIAAWMIVLHVYQNDVLSPSRAGIEESQEREYVQGSEIGASRPIFKDVASEREDESPQNPWDVPTSIYARKRGEEEAKLVRSRKLGSLLYPCKDQMAMEGSRAGNHSDVGCYYPGREWRDTSGNPIQAHGGGILYVPDTQTFYWYGENKNGRTYRLRKRGTTRVDVIGVSCYSSKDLWTWKFEGLALKGEHRDKNSDLYIKNVLERPKVIYNSRTKLYVMWMHIDNGSYSKAAAGVAMSTHPVGPFEYLGSKRPHGCDSRDMTVFKDDNGDAFIVYSSQSNNDLHVGALTEDYLDVVDRGMHKILVKQRREAPAVFKHNGIYYLLTSGCSGWDPNGALIHASTSMLGPWWTIGDPCVDGDEDLRSLTFFSQGSFVLPLPGLRDTFIYMGDRWLPANLRDSRYIWLPLTMSDAPKPPLSRDMKKPAPWQRVSLHWADKWKPPRGWNNHLPRGQ